ncbi:ABC-type multidrug transport system, permease component [Carnobacterium alterfunditum]|uniref:ABC-type multidrug transport system, permease component n=1 Tax=Carnobacterium alterfunditum TaxID=28230 RepID=A0A1N6ET36_9LACT|nr:ABC transporter permease [Carnobacterium alterfunditum]SIN86168.1 ABC-type multidrug transport system, permease component [Carnobacterium alterfunditum]
MKLFSSFIKELKIASRGFYFYIELFMAVLIVVIFLFAVPDNFNNKASEYLYLDMPNQASEVYLKAIAAEDLDGKSEAVKIEVDKKEKQASLYTTEDKEIYLLNSREDAEYLADKERKVAAVITMDSEQKLTYQYYLQGYESDKFKNLLKILHVESSETLETTMDSQDVRPLSTTSALSLSDKENMMPSVLVFNGALMGLFIIAAYIFLDKQEGVIKAYALTPSPVWHYLLSKIGVIMVTSIVSSFIVLLPIMRFKPDYLLLLALLISTAFFSSSLGLLIASFYRNIMEAFGAIYVFMMLMIIPNIAYLIPSWSPSFIKLIPSYQMLEGFKSVLLGNNDWAYVLTISGGFLIAGSILFMLSNSRYKKTLLR